MSKASVLQLENRMRRIRDKINKLSKEYQQLMKRPKAKQLEKSFSNQVDRICKKLRALGERHSALHRERWGI